MQEFLDNLYKHCAGLYKTGGDQIYRVVIPLAQEKKFDAINSILTDIDLSRIDSGTMYSIVHLVSNYSNVLPEYRNFYVKVREEFARRGKSSEQISNLMDKLENRNSTPYNPNKPRIFSLEEKTQQKLDEKIKAAQDAGDDDLAFFLQMYKESQLTKEEKEKKYRDLSISLGHEEVRKRCITALHKMAALLEKNTGGWPGIYYAELPKDLDDPSQIMHSIEVIVSYPWPG